MGCVVLNKALVALAVLRTLLRPERGGLLKGMH